jgi:hypothetical protein
MNGTNSSFAQLRDTWHFWPILPHILSSVILFPFVQNSAMTLIGGEISVNGL